VKAIVWTAYGGPDVLELQDIPKPLPEVGEVLVRVHATTVSAGDVEFRSLDLSWIFRYPVRAYIGLLRPKRVTVLGQEYAGEIESVGADVTAFAAGDRVFGQTDFTMGAYAEYLCVRAESGDGVLAPMPSNLTFEEAAAVPTGGLEALHYLRGADLQRGEHVLINGAGGSIGTAAVQLAKHYGAQVTAVDSAEKLEMLRSIGADAVVDYEREDFAAGGKRYDVIFDVPGKASYRACVRALKPGGRLLLANARLSLLLRGRWTSLTSDKRVLVGLSGQAREDLDHLRELVEAGTLCPVIDRTYLLEEVPDAHRYVGTGAKEGNVVVLVA
jgi:NADPH:quinone reductase-like Zn-dependent oxidoreductase